MSGPAKKVLPLDGFTAEAILRHFEAEAAFGAVEWPRIADASVLSADSLPSVPAGSASATAERDIERLAEPVTKRTVVSLPPAAPAVSLEAAGPYAPSAPSAATTAETVSGGAATPRVAAPADARAGATAGAASSTEEALAAIAAEAAACTACGLCRTRTRVVPGQGSPRARLMFVGEAPGETEDHTGLAFVGPAGELLTRMIQAMGLKREEVFIANILKCRPPDNRPPAPEEVRQCFHFLERQIAAINPEIICALGAHAATNLLGRDEPIGRLRGRTFTYGRSRLIATYHPSYLLRTPEKKKDAWADLQMVMRLLGLAPPSPKSPPPNA